MVSFIGDRQKKMSNSNAVIVSETIKTVLSAAVSNPSLFTTAVQKPPVIPGGFFPVSKKQMLRNLEINVGTRNLNSWVDSMRASSPTHVKSTPLTAEETKLMLEHPSALDLFEEIIHASRGKQIVMFLDYDGTLSPIVDDPERAFMSNKMRKTVKKLASYFPTAIVTGRCRDKVYEFVKLAELYYAGSHGMDIQGPTKDKEDDEEAILYQPARDFIPVINEVYRLLVQKTKLTPGAFVEHNKFCLSVHYRRVAEKQWSEVAELVNSVVQQYEGLKCTQGRMVFEIRPDIEWDKGRALEFLLESLGFSNCSDVLPVYIGDDRTDEDAFKILQKREQGFGILVSNRPRETHASYLLKEPKEVMFFLQKLVQWKQLTTGRRSRV
ncbi:Trehalose 6-phosphate phosphatase [Melia azedarach]|uniref:Trehalose 6-phosphate phosphatase n=1 Tax=Melia azedarach TaxID=155640 RepID=A0ACC1XX21_MELAZ|nr:Trehalose 6-phosphate phosphatase [Melia azedarach]